MSKALASEQVERDVMYVVGISAETTNADEMAGQGKIPGLWQRFFEEGIAGKIPNRVAADGIAVLYTDMQSDETGPYRFVLGALVSDLEQIPDGMVGRVAPAGRYEKITTPQGPLAEITMQAWQSIWQDTALKARRSYQGDLELYDERAQNPADGQFDILVGLK